MELFISAHPEFPDDIRQLLQTTSRVVVSGQPLNTNSVDGKERFHADCEFVIDVPIFVTLAVMGRIPSNGHSHVPPQFIGDYPMISGFDSNLNEYRFGVRPELGFQIAPFEGESDA